METKDASGSTVVEVRALSKRYGAGGRKRDSCVTQALDRVSFAVSAGEFTGIMLAEPAARSRQVAHAQRAGVHNWSATRSRRTHRIAWAIRTAASAAAPQRLGGRFDVTKLGAVEGAGAAHRLALSNVQGRDFGIPSSRLHPRACSFFQDAFSRRCWTRLHVQMLVFLVVYANSFALAPTIQKRRAWREIDPRRRRRRALVASRRCCRSCTSSGPRCSSRNAPRRGARSR